MPLDPSISLQAGQGVRPLDPMGAFQQALTLRALSDQSQAQQLALQQQQRAMQRQEGIGKAYAVGPDGQIDNETTIRNLIGGNYGPEAAQFSQQVMQQRLQNDKAQREAQKAEWEGEKARTETVVKQAALVRDEIAALGLDAPYHRVIAKGMELKAMGVPFDPSQVPNDPQELRAWMEQKYMGSESVIKNYEARFGPKSQQGQLAQDYFRAPPDQRKVLAPAVSAMGGPATALTRFDENGNVVPSEVAIRAAERVGKASATKIDNVNYPPGAVIPGKTTTGRIEEDLRSSGGRLSRLTQIERMFKPEFLNVQNRLSGSWSAIKEKLGANLNPKDKRFLAEFSQFKQSSIEQLNQYINEVTGAAVGVQEAPRLISAMPNPGSGAFDGDSPTEFKTKLDSVIKQVKMAEARQVYALRNGLSLFDGKGNPLISLEKMPKLMQDRGKELEAEMRKKFPQLGPKAIYEKVANQLGSEFGLASD